MKPSSQSDVERRVLAHLQNGGTLLFDPSRARYFPDEGGKPGKDCLPSNRLLELFDAGILAPAGAERIGLRKAGRP